MELLVEPAGSGTALLGEPNPVLGELLPGVAPPQSEHPPVFELTAA